MTLGDGKNFHPLVQDRLDSFYAESTSLLEDAIRHVFAEDLGQLALPPERMAVLVRILLEGLVVELAQARTQEDVAAVDQAFEDARALFARFVLGVPVRGDRASFGVVRIPFASTTNRARIASPRSVSTVQRLSDASHVVLVTVVWNRQRS